MNLKILRLFGFLCINEATQSVITNHRNHVFRVHLFWFMLSQLEILKLCVKDKGPFTIAKLRFYYKNRKKQAQKSQ